VDFDDLYVQASTDGGTTWNALDGAVNGQPFARDSSDTPALTGTTDGAWQDMHVSLDQFAGSEVQLRFRCRTDGAVIEDGFFANEITVSADGAPIFTDGAESGTNRWTLDGSVQLRLPHEARLGRALPVPDRASRLVLGHVPDEQQHGTAPG
jgi:immune inhibitor A